jgi:hypothetical protein
MLYLIYKIGDDNMKNTTSIKIPKYLQHMVEEVYKDSEKGYWCHASKGYYFNDVDYGIHIVGEDTQKQLIEKIRSLKSCDCNECMSS